MSTTDGELSPTEQLKGRRAVDASYDDFVSYCGPALHSVDWGDWRRVKSKSASHLERSRRVWLSGLASTVVQYGLHYGSGENVGYRDFATKQVDAVRQVQLIETQHAPKKGALGHSPGDVYLRLFTLYSRLNVQLPTDVPEIDDNLVTRLFHQYGNLSAMDWRQTEPGSAQYTFGDHRGGLMVANQRLETGPESTESLLQVFEPENPRYTVAITAALGNATLALKQAMNLLPPPQ